jgi:hypothetical protein
MLKFGTRYYMPNLARWTQIDPKAGQPQRPLTLNAYLYTGQDPVNRTDRSGRDWDILGGLNDAYTLLSDLAEGDYESAWYHSQGILAGMATGIACGATTALTGGAAIAVCGFASVIIGSAVEYVYRSNEWTPN